ncbi:MAG: hypothetical protein NZ699_03335 [Roseiflexus sp.]|nr:hypothetical protein [Roseiflexus sp.]MCS7288146.1 hypothetical protein [Roseiflexus sp.]MDW8145953.1 hypothetical protein [Roseiflexaceae bacterium]MDW8232588.1 hypothetical protein [Roseiflexaceae bacterium]
MSIETSVNGLAVETRSGMRVELSGALAGLIGGVMMAIVGAALALAIGDDLWKAPKLIATFVVSPATVAAPGFLAGPVIIGSMIHLALSVLFGIGFGVLTTRVWNMPLNYGAPMVLGLVYGLAIWLIAYFIVLPLINPLLLEIYAPAFLIQNLTYGLSTGLAYGVLHSASLVTNLT